MPRIVLWRPVTPVSGFSERPNIRASEQTARSRGGECVTGNLVRASLTYVFLGLRCRTAFRGLLGVVDGGPVHWIDTY